MSGQGGIGSFLPLIVMIVAAWFLLIRPQQQRQKKQAEMLSRLAPGAEVLTVGGIFGTIVEMGDDRLRIAVADGSELEIVRGSVQTIVTPADVAPELEEADADEDADQDADEAAETPVADEGKVDA
jgi:preprotein translocase subunit YajC